MFKNMKIEINAEQPIGEVVAEIERLGYELDTVSALNPTIVLTWDFGSYDRVNTDVWYDFNDTFDYEWRLTTLTELKDM